MTALALALLLVAAVFLAAIVGGVRLRGRTRRPHPEPFARPDDWGRQ